MGLTPAAPISSRSPGAEMLPLIPQSQGDLGSLLRPVAGNDPRQGNSQSQTLAILDWQMQENPPAKRLPSAGTADTIPAVHLPGFRPSRRGNELGEWCSWRILRSFTRQVTRNLAQNRRTYTPRSLSIPTADFNVTSALTRIVAQFVIQRSKSNQHFSGVKQCSDDSGCAWP